MVRIPLRVLTVIKRHIVSDKPPWNLSTDRGDSSEHLVNGNHHYQINESQAIGDVFITPTTDNEDNRVQQNQCISRVCGREQDFRAKRKSGCAM